MQLIKISLNIFNLYKTKACVKIVLVKMNQPEWEQDRLKVDATALRKDHTNGYLIIYNINVPADIIHDNNEKRDVLIRIRDLLMTDFRHDLIHYQITAAYYLVHRVTGEQRIWVGSFFPGGNGPAVIRDFQLFNANTFVGQAFEDTENCEDDLTWRGVNTAWVFDSLISVIFNCQVDVRTNHSALYKRNLYSNNARHLRAHVTFNLP